MKLSIIVPSYQQGRYLGRTLRSIIDQGSFDREIFALDGGSTDESIDVIRQHEANITWWRSRKDEGQTAAINEGLARCTGDVVAYINSDDYYLPGAFNAVEQWYDDQGKSGSLWLAGACHAIDETTGSKQTVQSTPAPKDHAVILGHPWCPPQPSCFWHRKLFDELGPFDASLRYVMDVEWNVRCLLKGYAPQLTDEILSVRWLHDEAKSFVKTRFFEEMHCVVDGTKSLTDSEKKGAHALIGTRENALLYYQGWHRFARLFKDFLVYPPIIKTWMRRLQIPSR